EQRAARAPADGRPPRPSLACAADALCQHAEVVLLTQHFPELVRAFGDTADVRGVAARLGALSPAPRDRQRVRAGAARALEDFSLVAQVLDAFAPLVKRARAFALATDLVRDRAPAAAVAAAKRGLDCGDPLGATK